MSKLVFVVVACILIVHVYAQSAPRVCCNLNEVYLPQGTAPNCDTVCTEIGNPCTRIYIQAPFGCYCLPNYARNASNVCVPINECPITCNVLV